MNENVATYDAFYKQISPRTRSYFRCFRQKLKIPKNIHNLQKYP